MGNLWLNYPPHPNTLTSFSSIFLNFSTREQLENLPKKFSHFEESQYFEASDFPAPAPPSKIN